MVLYTPTRTACYKVFIVTLQEEPQTTDLGSKDPQQQDISASVQRTSESGIFVAVHFFGSSKCSVGDGHVIKAVPLRVPLPFPPL